MKPGTLICNTNGQRGGGSNLREGLCKGNAWRGTVTPSNGGDKGDVGSDDSERYQVKHGFFIHAYGEYQDMTIPSTGTRILYG